jgi:Holliday junction resolvase RusA-like endonuclease
MATYKFEIDKRLMGLNEYTKANRTNKYVGSQAKKDEQRYIEWCIIEQLGNLRIDKPVKGKFTWIEENKRRDLDNICFAKKFILDALVDMKVLKDDNRKIVTSFVDEFKYADKSKVIVELEEI